MGHAFSLPILFQRALTGCGTGLLTLAVLLMGCHAAPPRAVDAELASCIPADTQILAGIHLDEVRTNPVLRKLSSNWLALLDPARDASSILIAYNGKDLLWAGRGQFHAPPAGSTLLTPQIAVAGPTPQVRAAAAQHAARRTGAPELVGQAETIAQRPVWAVIKRGGALPLSGNAANLNHILGLADYTTLAIELNSTFLLHVTGICHSAGQARQMEETLRGLISLASANTRERDVAALLKKVEIRRDDVIVHADVSASPDDLNRLITAVPR